MPGRCCRKAAPASGHRRFDVAGAVTVTGGLSLLVYAVVTAGHGWGIGHHRRAARRAAALIAAFVLIEARSAAPLLPLSFFRNRTVTAAERGRAAARRADAADVRVLVAVHAAGAGLLADPGRAGVPGHRGGIIASSGLAQHLVTRPRQGGAGRWAAGFAAAQVLFTRLPAAGSYPAHLLPGFLLVAAALGLAFVGASSPRRPASSPPTRAWPSGLINTSQQIGGAVGLAVTTTIATARTASLLHAGHPPAAAVTGGFHDAFAVTGVLALIAAAVAIGLVRRAPAAAPAAEPPASRPQPRRPGPVLRSPTRILGSKTGDVNLQGIRLIRHGGLSPTFGLG